MAVSKRLRFEILRRDNHTCRYCGASAPATPLRVDHVVPAALGGSDHPSNLVTSCEPCNSGKTSTIVGTVGQINVEAFPPSPDDLAGEALKIWTRAYSSVYGLAPAEQKTADTVRDSARDMYKNGVSADSIRRSALMGGLTNNPFVGLGETSDANWLLLAAVASRVWRYLWIRSSNYEELPSIGELALLEASVEDAANSEGADYHAILTAAAAAGIARTPMIEDFLNPRTKGGTS